MNYWVVKGSPAENGTFAFIRPGKAHTWRTKRPPRGWLVGDRLLFWASSPRLELIALGEFHGETGRLTEDGQTIYGVQYLTPVLKRPLLLAELRADGVFNDASFLKSGPAQSVFAVSEEQGIHIYRLLASMNANVAGVWPDIEVVDASIPDVDESAIEGDKRLTQHFRRERSPTLVVAKKARVLDSSGKLACEACSFDFRARYGSLGENFCEVHHRHPLAAREGPRTTSLDDLAIVCSNCHRMLHKSACSISVEQLRARLISSEAAKKT